MFPIQCPTSQLSTNNRQWHQTIILSNSHWFATNFTNCARHSWSLTQTTALQKFQTVQGNMTAKIFPASEWFVTNKTPNGCSSVWTTLGELKVLITKWSTTHITVVRTLSSMDTLLFIQSKLLGKGFITHITNVRTLSSMYTVGYCEVTEN